MNLMSKKLLRIIISLVVFSVVDGLFVPILSTATAFTRPVPLESSDATMWESLSKDFKIPCDTNNPHIRKQIIWYQKHPRHFRKILMQSQPFLHYVYQQTQNRSLPAELALIPLLESQYNPVIKAKSGATGLWQIMPHTAKKFGLRINDGYDGRRDVAASTKAALNYLSYLHRYFKKDWLLALAAYDLGEGRVKSVQYKHHSNFWGLPFPKETKNYVPKILAIASIIKDPDQYHMTLPDLKNDTLKEVSVDKQMEFAEAAELIGVNVHTLHQLNPAFAKSRITQPGHTTLLVPTTIDNHRPDVTNEVTTISEKSDDEKSDEIVDTTEKMNVVVPKLYTVKSKDSLYKIAKNYHVSIKQLKKINHLKTSKLKNGQIIQIPSHNRNTITTTSKKPHRKQVYKIRSGDTLAKIAKKFHVTISELKQWNSIKDEKHLKLGRRLHILQNNQ